LQHRVREVFMEHPALRWDAALVKIVTEET
jgi:hypothetical protein